MAAVVFSDLGVEQGNIRLFTSQPGKPHPQQFWVDRAMERVMSVADTAPQPIRDQAHAFRAQIAMVIAQTVAHAVADQRAYDILAIEAISREAAAALRGK